MDIAVDTTTDPRRSEQEPAAVPEWDWEAARVDGKLIRCGYQRDRVLVLVLSLSGPKPPEC